MQKTILLTKKQESLQNNLINSATKIKNEINSRNEFKSLTVFLSLLSVAVAGRIALQYLPSIEPIIPLAIIAGILFGAKEGFVFGSSAYIISNFFVFGLQGPWTVFQAIGAGLAGMLGFKAKNELKTSDLIFYSVIGTIIFETIMNLSGSLMGIGFLGGIIALPIYFVFSLPFSIAHIAGNVFFSKLFYPLTKLRRNSNEIKIYSVKHNANTFTWVSMRNNTTPKDN